MTDLRWGFVYEIADEIDVNLTSLTNSEHQFTNIDWLVIRSKLTETEFNTDRNSFWLELIKNSFIISRFSFRK